MSKLYRWLLLLCLFLAACSTLPEPAVLDTARPATTQTLPQPTITALPPTILPTMNISPTLQASSTALLTPTQTAASIADVIEYEMKGAFDFFWEQANIEPASPGYGLIRDRYPGSPGVASMASVGFGLTAYLVGVEKGYIDYEQAAERVDGTLDTLLAMDRMEGFYYHFVDMETGQRVWESEVSSIDTSILLMGVLTAGEYFGGEIQQKAQQIYAEVNWPWFLDPERQMFFMAYRPGKGFDGHWDFYAEQLMIYVLAAGSPTYPVDERPYYAFTRHFGRYGEGQPFIHSWFGSLFTYQYSHAWIDFRDYTDRKGVNWFDNSVAASQAQVDFATEMQSKYETLAPDAWGLTASDGPGGYNGLYGAPPSGFDNRQHFIDDTVAPSGAIGSIIFVPDHAEAALLNFYSIEPLKSAYGFLDAYNLADDWYASDVIGIDKGISLLMLANYQSNLVYRVSMQNQSVLAGLERLQITKNRP